MLRGSARSEEEDDDTASPTEELDPLGYAVGGVTADLVGRATRPLRVVLSALVGGDEAPLPSSCALAPVRPPGARGQRSPRLEGLIWSDILVRLFPVRAMPTPGAESHCRALIGGR